MSEEQLKAFLEKVKGDTSLQDTHNGAADSGAVVEVASEAVLSFYAEAMLSSTVELSDEELEGAAGGGCGDVGLKELTQLSKDDHDFKY